MDHLLFVGPRMKKAFHALAPQGLSRARAFEDVRDARAFLRRSAEKGDAVLLKASRGMRLEKLMEGFKK
jgi:UDP-N-acetylmuramyl pentapeptide synthase